ncbi:hypothetical protein EVAR_96093_1 [Eumeta japonica]|uniref:Uncharacterized protein n=1 Tax=Eumeta variegata TaxID=151549 RepID=A0A4C1VF16_EUMVA|nr:hypothetical protein EVAR_96093_1 [Eumeta japonica]
MYCLGEKSRESPPAIMSRSSSDENIPCARVPTFLLKYRLSDTEVGTSQHRLVASCVNEVMKRITELRNIAGCFRRDRGGDRDDVDRLGDLSTTSRTPAAQSVKARPKGLVSVGK